MLAVRLDPETERELTELAEATGRSKSYYVKQAIDEFLADRADYLEAIAVLERAEPRYSIEAIRKEFGLEH